MTSLSTHVLDLGSGQPGTRIEVVLEQLGDASWEHVADGLTDENGRLADLGEGLGSGTYRLSFHTGNYGHTFFPEVHIVVTLSGDEEHYHVPLLLSPFGYTTYRGS